MTRIRRGSITSSEQNLDLHINLRLVFFFFFLNCLRALSHNALSGPEKASTARKSLLARKMLYFALYKPLPTGREVTR